MSRRRGVGSGARPGQNLQSDDRTVPDNPPIRPSVASWISPKARKGGSSPIEGRGVHALEPINAGEVVAVKGGHIVDAATLEDLPHSLRRSEFQIAGDLFLAAVHEDEYEAVMMFVNHSCEPNLGMAGNIVLVAMRDVAPGEELTIDYALFDDSEEVMECRCGAAGCRGTITGKDWMRAELQDRYQGWFSWWVQRRIEQSAGGQPPS
jgi:SET domain-containing protein